MKILVIGGTHFVGRHFVGAALAHGHELTLFNRGRSGTSLFPNVENLVGDREQDLSALEGRKWDAVVDTCGYVPRVVRMSAELLKNAVDRYLFVSTISVYATPMQPGENEDAALETLADPTTENVNEAYGGLKVLCEQAVQEIYGDRGVIVRPGMIVGPNDPTDRYTYWAMRIARGGEVLLPQPPERPVQMIDARDLGGLMVGLLEQEASGVLNATGPTQPLTWAQWMGIFAEAAGSSPSLTWVPEDFLVQQGLNAGDLPFWFPPQYGNIFTVSVQRALDAGLTYRPSLETARDTLAWKGQDALVSGLKPEREAELLALWHQQK